MTTFENGPAKGRNLMLHRAAKFLRVTETVSREFDALDQIEDTARSEEQLYAYRITAKPGRVHIYRRGKGAKSGWYPVAHYRFVDPQPPDGIMRDNERWTQWCKVNDFELP